MSLKLYLFLVTCVVIVGVASADIFGDFFKWDLMSAFSGGDEEEEEALQREEEDSSLQSTCDCKGMKCDCCVDFNISSVIDLGGPGCVNMRYISKEEGVLLNVSYGDNVLHSQTVSSQGKKGTCMSLLSFLAEICARFANLKETGDGMFGCLNFEPTVFGEVTSQYPVGCFRMGPDGMFVDNSLANDTEVQEGEGGKDSEVTTKKPEEEEEEDQSFMEVVNQSAQESLEFFSNLFGFGVGNKKNTKNTTEETETQTSAQSSRLLNKKNFKNTKNLQNSKNLANEI